MRCKHVKITSAGAGSVYNIDGSDGASVGPTVIALSSVDIDNPAAVGVPAWSKTVDISAEGINWRWRADTGTLSSTQGMPLVAGSTVTMGRIDFTKFKFTQVAGAGAILNVVFWDGISPVFSSGVIVT